MRLKLNSGVISVNHWGNRSDLWGLSLRNVFFAAVTLFQR